MYRNRNSTTIIAAALLSLVVIRHLAVAQTPQGDRPSCEVCHSKVAVDYHDGIHAAAHVACVDCHGGNPDDMAVSAMSPAAGFKGKPSRAQIPIFCSRCHSNAGLMKQYGLPAHQLEDYKTSRHGQAWARGDGNVAVCIDCHGSHGMRAVSDANSMVYRANVAKTCARCHANAQLMRRYGLPSNVYDDYEKSTHAKLLAAGGRLAAPSCPQCHGAHTALPPMIGQIQNVCGQCHRPITELVYNNPHAVATRHKQFGQCTSCHSNHAILPPTQAMLLTTCRQCHAEGSEAAQVGQKIEQMIANAQNRHELAQRWIDFAASRGGGTEKLTARLEEATNKLKQIATDQHSLSPQKVEEDILAIESVSDEISADAAQTVQSLAMRRWAVVPLWGYLLFTLGTLYWKRRRVEAREAETEASGASYSQDGGSQS